MNIAGFQARGGDRMIGISADAGAVGPKVFTKLFSPAIFAALATPHQSLRRAAIAAGVELGCHSRCNLRSECVERRQWLVLRQQVIQSFLIGVLEGGAIRQQQQQTSLDRPL